MLLLVVTLALAGAGLATPGALFVGAPAQLVGAEVVSRPRLPAGEEVVDETVASVELEGDGIPRFALRSELELLMRVELLARGAPDALRTRVDVTASRAWLEQLLGEELVLREAQRAGEDTVSASVLTEERARLAARFRGADVAELLAVTGATEDELVALVRRRVVALRFLVGHQRRMIEPSEVDLRQAYENPRFEALRRGEVPVAVARARIRLELLRTALPGAVRQYLRALGSRARVRVFADAAGGEAARSGDVP